MPARSPAPRVVTLLASGALALTSLTSVAAAAPATGVPGGTTTPVPTTDDFVPVAGPVFGDPTTARNRIITRLLRNIAHTPAGGTIQIVGYSFSLDKVAAALQAAHERGVAVQVVVNGHSRSWLPARRLVPALGKDVRQSSFFLLTHGSARGTGGVTHQKSWTFSQVGQTPDVVMVGSTNLTGYGTQVQWSDTYVYTNRPDVYGVYAALFDVQKRDRPVSDPFVSTDFADGGAYFFPRPGTTARSDPARLRIAELPDGAGTTIRVSQFAWYGPRGTWLARALARKKRTGATVSVVAGQSVGGAVKGVLAAADIPIRSGVFAHGKRIHTKLMLASYSDSTGAHTSIWTGSDNWADQSFGNDEDVVRVDDDAAGYQAYVGFFDHLAQMGAVVTVPTAVGVEVSRARVHRTRPAYLSGTVRPVYAGRTVLVQRHLRGRTVWHTVAGSGALHRASYSVALPTRKVGSWFYRTVVAAAPNADAGVSATVRLRVRR
jgi:hypothetical protein